MAPTSTDVLGEPYLAETLELRPDDEGEVVATLVSRPAPTDTGRAVLHVHGFADYFFQTAAADFWVEQGYAFHALDLRKYGRSLRAHQTPNYIADLRAYYEEIDLAYARIRETHDRVVLSAHSTGGLTSSLWAHDRQPDIDAVVLNSPWLAMVGGALTRNMGMPALHRLGAVAPKRVIPRSVNGLYARSLHRDYQGEWDFNLAWKPLASWPVYAGWLRTVRIGQARVLAGLDVPAPILVLASARSARPEHIDDPDLFATDVVLDVEQIRRRAALLGRHVTLAMVPGAMHDVTLSRPEARKAAFDEVAHFLSAYVDG